MTHFASFLLKTTTLSFQAFILMLADMNILLVINFFRLFYSHLLTFIDVINALLFFFFQNERFFSPSLLLVCIIPKERRVVQLIAKLEAAK